MKTFSIIFYFFACLSLVQTQIRQNNILNLKKLSADTAALRRAYIGGTLQTFSSADSELTVEHGVHIKRGVRVDGGVEGSTMTLRNSPIGSMLIITDTTNNKNTSSPAQATDTSAFNFSFTGTHKPILSIIGVNGNPELVVDSTGMLGIGVLPSQILHTQTSTTPSWINEVYGGSSVFPTITGKKAGGIPNSPTATSANSTLIRLSGSGYTGTGFTGSKGIIDIMSAENWSTTSNGSYIRFWTTKIGTTNVVERVRIDDNGNFGLGTSTPNLAMDILKGFAIRDSTPTQIASNQNDYAIGTVSILRLNTDISRTISGFNNGFPGRFLYIINTGSNNLILSNQNTASQAQNRIISGNGSDITLASDQSIILWYDNTSQRWRRIQ
ncbi:MAG: hypothetical protein ACHQQQ_00030 [Bacteroidota bacterium]